jgi:Skp family chaperone for outer membrane proteins
MQELPDIDLVEDRKPILPQPSGADDSKRTAGAWLSAFVAIVLSAAIAVGITLTGRDRILSAFGSSLPKQPDPYQQHFDAINAALSAMKTDLDSVQRSLKSETENASAHAFEQSKIEQRLTVIERFATDLEQRVKTHQAATVRQPAPKKPVVAKPKPAPVIPPVLVSIRNISGVTYVALRDGLDESDLLMPGDTWKGWTFIEADHFRKVATFRYQDSVRELAL